jgi:hypothetical protein
MEQRRRKRLSVAVSFQERTYVEEEHDDEEGVGQKENVPPKPRNAKPNVSFDRKKSIVQFKENDDAVEKRNRRKSRIMMEEALGGTSFLDSRPFRNLIAICPQALHSHPRRVKRHRHGRAWRQVAADF